MVPSYSYSFIIIAKVTFIHHLLMHMHMHMVHQGPLLLAWFNFYPNMVKSLNASQYAWWNYLSIIKLHRCSCQSWGMEKQFHPTFYQACDYWSMLGYIFWLSQIRYMRGTHCSWTHCGPVPPELWWHRSDSTLAQIMTCSYVDFSSTRLRCTHLRRFSQDVLKMSSRLTCLKKKQL